MNKSAVVLALVLLCALFISASESKITRVFGEVHLGTYINQGEAAHNLLRDFLITIPRQNDTIANLVLLGDFFDFWLRPFNTYPLTVNEILNSTNLFGADITEYIGLLNDIQQSGIQVYYVTGNADSVLNQTALAQYIPGVILSQRVLVMDNVRFDHGSNWDLFNAPDPNNNLPFGYYLSRALATSNTSSGLTTIGLCKSTPKSQFSANVVTALRQSAIFTPVITSMLTTALQGNTYQLPIVGGGLDGQGGNATTISVIADKGGLVQRWYTQTGDINAVKGLIDGACGDLSYWIPYVPSDVAILAHTGIPLLEQVSRDIKGVSNVITYANVGNWVDNGTFTYIDVFYDYDVTNHPTRVTLNIFNDSGAFSTNTTWLGAPDVAEMQNHLREKYPRFYWDCGLPVACPTGTNCTVGIPRANMITLAILSSEGNLLSGGISPVSWAGRTYGVIFGELEYNDTDGRLMYYAPEDGDTYLALAQWWSTTGYVEVNSLNITKGGCGEDDDGVLFGLKLVYLILILIAIIVVLIILMILIILCCMRICCQAALLACCPCCACCC